MSRYGLAFSPRENFKFWLKIPPKSSQGRIGRGKNARGFLLLVEQSVPGWKGCGEIMMRTGEGVEDDYFDYMGRVLNGCSPTWLLKMEESKY